MNFNKSKLALLVIIATFIGIGVFAMSSSDDKKAMDMRTMSSNQIDNVTDASKPNTVTMKDIEYTVKKLTVKKGSTVTWRNDDTAKHDVVFNDTTAISMTNSTGLLDMGETREYTFTKTGTFSYHCTPHPFMQAEIEVVN